MFELVGRLVGRVGWAGWWVGWLVGGWLCEGVPANLMFVTLGQRYWESAETA